MFKRWISNLNRRINGSGPSIIEDELLHNSYGPTYQDPLVKHQRYAYEDTHARRFTSTQDPVASRITQGLPAKMWMRMCSFYESHELDSKPTAEKQLLNIFSMTFHLPLKEAIGITMMKF